MNANKNIIELIKDCNYQQSYKDYIMKILIELSSNKNAVFFKTVHPQSQNKILAIKYPLNIKLKGNSYEIKLTIYIPSDFPEKAPEIFIDNNGDPLLAVNPKNCNVNPETFKVMTSKLFNWEKFTSIQQVITEILNSFEMNFPIYKKKQGVINTNNNPNSTPLNITGGGFIPNYNPINNSIQNNSWIGINCNNNNINPNPISITMNNQNFNLGPGPINNFSNNNINYNNNNNTNQNNTNKLELDIKKSLIEEIKLNCESKIKTDIKILKSQEEKLNNYKQTFISQIEKIKSTLNKRGENEKTLIILKNELESDITTNRNLIDKLCDKNLTKENCFNFVEIKNPEENFIQILAMEASIEDMYLIVKRGFEKGVINFNETMKFIRTLSKEAVKIKFLRDKIRKKYDKDF